MRTALSAMTPMSLLDPEVAFPELFGAEVVEDSGQDLDAETGIDFSQVTFEGGESAMDDLALLQQALGGAVSVVDADSPDEGAEPVLPMDEREWL